MAGRVWVVLLASRRCVEWCYLGRDVWPCHPHPKAPFSFPFKAYGTGEEGRVCVCVRERACGDAERSSTPLGWENSQWPRGEPKALIRRQLCCFQSG